MVESDDAEESLNEKPVTERAVDKILSDKPAQERTASEKILASAAALMPSGVTPLSPSALSAAVAPTSSTRTNLRVVPNPSPLAASLPNAAAAAATSSTTASRPRLTGPGRCPAGAAAARR